MKKIYWAIVLLSLILISIFILRCHLSFSSFLSPVELVSRTQFRIDFLKEFTLITSVLILILSNFIGYTTQQAGLVFVSFLMYSIGILFTYYFAELLFIFKKQNDLWEGGFSLNPFIGFSFALLAFILVSINYRVLKKFISKSKEIT